MEMVLFVTINRSSFVQADLDLLRRTGPVRDFYYRPSRSLAPNLWRQARLLLWLARHIGRASSVFVWFADYHAFLPVFFANLFGKRSVLVLAGYDVASFPALRYGAFVNPLRSFCAGFAIGRATVIAPVAESLARAAGKRVPRIRGRVHPVPFGFDASRWRRDAPKEKLVLTVGFADDETRVRIKGLDLFVEAARLLPEYRFLLVGAGPGAMRHLDLPRNVEAADRLPREKLRPVYSRAKVYAPLSLSEPMPNVVCEAMLCECVPVGTEAGGIPDVIGDCGFIVKGRDPRDAAAAIRRAMVSPASLGAAARRRVAENFTSSRREAALLSLVTDGDAAK